MVWNKENNLYKAVWVNEVVSFIQPFCFTIELLAFQSSNFKLWRSSRYCSCLTHFELIFSFMSPENIKNLWFSVVSKSYIKVILTSNVLILVVYRNYNVLQSFTFEKYWLGKGTYLCKIWNFKFRISIFNWYFPFSDSTI